MSNTLVNLGADYADALKEALALRREGTASRAVDDQIGIMAHSIAQWSISVALSQRKLWKELAHDPDFQSEVLLGILRKLDTVSLDREPKEIVKYLYMVGRSAIKDKLHYNGASKRSGITVPLDGITRTANFYGDWDGHVQYDMDGSSRAYDVSE